MTSELWNGIHSIDHPLIAVSDMDRARRVYERLGFIVPPRGSHLQWGTGNWCILFERDYLELRGILDPGRPLRGLDSHLENMGEGLMGLAFGSNDAALSRDALKRNGIGVRELEYLSRNFERPEGWTQPRFALCFPEETEVLGLLHVVLCQHLTPRLLRDDAYLGHPNGATGVVGILGQAMDLDTVEKIQRDFLGNEAVIRTEKKLRLQLPNDQFVEISGIAPNAKGQKVNLIAIRIAVKDILKTKDILDKSNIPFCETVEDYLVAVPEAYACGTRLEFVEL